MIQEDTYLVFSLGSAALDEMRSEINETVRTYVGQLSQPAHLAPLRAFECRCGNETDETPFMQISSDVRWSLVRQEEGVAIKACCWDQPVFHSNPTKNAVWPQYDKNIALPYVLPLFDALFDLHHGIASNFNEVHNAVRPIFTAADRVRRGQYRLRRRFTLLG